jgi:hypothetical protein
MLIKHRKSWAVFVLCIFIYKIGSFRISGAAMGAHNVSVLNNRAWLMNPKDLSLIVFPEETKRI